CNLRITALPVSVASVSSGSLAVPRRSCRLCRDSPCSPEPSSMRKAGSLFEPPPPSVSPSGVRVFQMPWSLDAPPVSPEGFTFGGFRLVPMDFLRRHDHESSSLPFRLHVRPFGWVRHPSWPLLTS